jgi:hypothetical protein
VVKVTDTPLPSDSASALLAEGHSGTAVVVAGEESNRAFAWCEVSVASDWAPEPVDGHDVKAVLVVVESSSLVLENIGGTRHGKLGTCTWNI